MQLSSTTNHDVRASSALRKKRENYHAVGLLARVIRAPLRSELTIAVRGPAFFSNFECGWESEDELEPSSIGAEDGCGLGCKNSRERHHILRLKIVVGISPQAVVGQVYWPALIVENLDITRSALVVWVRKF